MESILKNNLDALILKRGGCESNTAFLLDLLSTHLPKEHFAIAVSGGLDSMALLHAATVISSERKASLSVFHVHHGLHENAHDWLEHIAHYCSVQNITFDVRYLDVTTRKNAQSIEDWARQERYLALKEMADEKNIKYIWLAHHQDDQIETHLLQKARGAGARGLSAMPRELHKLGLVWQRPWLYATQKQLSFYVREHQIKHIHDSSNDDSRFARNALRIELQQQTSEERLLILEAIAQAQQQHAKEQFWAKNILQEYIVTHRPDIGELSCLRGLNLRQYQPERQCLLLRAWFDLMGKRMPTKSGLSELLKQLNSERTDQNMYWQHSDGWGVTRFKNDLIAVSIDPAKEWCLSESLQQWIKQEGLIARKRQGGERIRLAANRSSLSLKEAYVAARIAPILRAQLPLLYRGNYLVYVVGIGLVC